MNNFTKYKSEILRILESRYIQVGNSDHHNECACALENMTAELISIETEMGIVEDKDDYDYEYVDDLSANQVIISNTQLDVLAKTITAMLKRDLLLDELNALLVLISNFGRKEIIPYDETKATPNSQSN